METKAGATTAAASFPLIFADEGLKIGSSSAAVPALTILTLAFLIPAL